MLLLCHLWLTTANLSYRFPILETSTAALCGTIGSLLEDVIKCVAVFAVFFMFLCFYVSMSQTLMQFPLCAALETWEKRGLAEEISMHKGARMYGAMYGARLEGAVSVLALLT